MGGVPQDRRAQVLQDRLILRFPFFLYQPERGPAMAGPRSGLSYRTSEAPIDLFLKRATIKACYNGRRPTGPAHKTKGVCTHDCQRKDRRAAAGRPGRRRPRGAGHDQRPPQQRIPARPLQRPALVHRLHRRKRHPGGHPDRQRPVGGRPVLCPGGQAAGRHRDHLHARRGRRRAHGGGVPDRELHRRPDPAAGRQLRPRRHGGKVPGRAGKGRRRPGRAGPGEPTVAGPPRPPHPAT